MKLIDIVKGYIQGEIPSSRHDMYKLYQLDSTFRDNGIFDDIYLYGNEDGYTKDLTVFILSTIFQLPKPLQFYEGSGWIYFGCKDGEDFCSIYMFENSNKNTFIREYFLYSTDAHYKEIDGWISESKKYLSNDLDHYHYGLDSYCYPRIPSFKEMVYECVIDADKYDRRDLYQLCCESLDAYLGRTKNGYKPRNILDMDKLINKMIDCYIDSGADLTEIFEKVFSIDNYCICVI